MMQLLTTSCFLLLNMVIGQSLAQVTLIRCERTLQTFWETNLALACTGSDVLDIQAGNFGRTSATVCPGAPGSVTNVVDCVEPATLEVMRDACHGESTCVLEPTTDFFTSTACPAVYKYVNVTYQCGPAPTPPAATSRIANQVCLLEDSVTSPSDPTVTTFHGDLIEATLSFATNKREDVQLLATDSGDDYNCKFRSHVTMKKDKSFPPGKVDIIHFSFGDHEKENQFARKMKYLKNSHRLVVDSPDLTDSLTYDMAVEQYEFSEGGVSMVVTGTADQGFHAHSPGCGWVLEYMRLEEEDVVRVSLPQQPVVGLCGRM